MKIRVAGSALAFVLLVFAGAPARAEVRLPSIFGDHMVLQRGQPLPVWGRDDPGAEVTVTLGEASASAKADADGRWAVELPARKAGGPHRMTIRGTSEVILEDVLVGEVWLCSGQSNMEWTVSGSKDAEAEIEGADHPRIRHIKIGHRPAASPEDDVPSSGWKVCSPATVGEFTGVGYSFGRRLLEDLDVPVGLVGVNWGGTRIEPWTPPSGFRAVPALKESHADRLDEFPEKDGKGRALHQSPLAL